MCILLTSNVLKLRSLTRCEICLDQNMYSLFYLLTPTVTSYNEMCYTVTVVFLSQSSLVYHPVFVPSSEGSISCSFNSLVFVISIQLCLLGCRHAYANVIHICSALSLATVSA